ncbi:hypothetical protein [Algoriphagus sp. PAP.12]|uniref:hypothetical protein n=1 Tax=Algoriphagus sp. PAP.12 TaxID=2996678 RepID=UPI00227C81B5|nr:hypothetical protein [Algoriphagus sp. PAP.12]
MIKYIFSINTGRSGSHYLSKMLQNVEGINSFHEPYPVMNGYPMIKYLKGKEKELRSQMPEKLRQIEKNLDNGKVYVETNHMFIKGFGWLIPENIPQENIGVVLIKKNKTEVAKSHYRIFCSPLSIFGKLWLMFPTMKNPINKFSKPEILKYRLYFFINRFLMSRYNPFKDLKLERRIFKSYELKLLEWYVEETYSQAERFRRKYPKIKVFETTIEKLNDVEEYERLFKFFKLEFKPKDSFFEKLNTRTNLKRIAS